jgi:hypothetical protein
MTDSAISTFIPGSSYDVELRADVIAVAVTRAFTSDALVGKEVW